MQAFLLGKFLPIQTGVFQMVKMSNFTDNRLISKVILRGEEDRENKLGKLCKKLSPDERNKFVWIYFFYLKEKENS